jgi:hypothetical protein
MENLKSGFRATGIFPCSEKQALSRLLHVSSMNENSFNATVTHILSIKRFNTVSTSTAAKRPCKKNSIGVAAGFSCAGTASDNENDLS